MAGIKEAKVLESVGQNQGLTLDEIVVKTKLTQDDVSFQLSKLCQTNQILCRSRPHALGDVFRAEYWPT